MGGTSGPARGPRAALAAVPADADTLAVFPAGDAGTNVVDHAGDFVPGGAVILTTGPVSFFYEAVAVADATGLHANADVAGGRLRDVALLNFKIGARLGYDGDLHLWHKAFLVDGSHPFGWHLLDTLLRRLVMPGRPPKRKIGLQFPLRGSRLVDAMAITGPCLYPRTN